jgi:transcription antitermination factor NusG
VSRWYVLQVTTDSEIQTAERLFQDGFRTIAPQELNYIRRGGKWQRELRLLFQGYVFIKLDYSGAKYHQVRCVSQVIRFLGDSESPSYLIDDEAALIERLSLQPTVLPSTVRFNEDGSYKILKGVLKAFETREIKMNRRQKRAEVVLLIDGQKKKVRFAINEAIETTG